ncbi:MAG: hypothetical protein IRY86_02360 [Thermorudis peleae]|nr:hypothetical protein [Thermorudis peleae]
MEDKRAQYSDHRPLRILVATPEKPQSTLLDKSGLVAITDDITEQQT